MTVLDLDKYEFSPFDKIGNQWMLISAGTEDKCSTLTASWGGLGVLWGKKVSYIFVRPQRHTLPFIEENEYYSLSFFDEKYRQALNYCGTHSGGENKKIEDAGLTLEKFDKAPIYKEAKITLICRKLYKQSIKPDLFIYKSFDSKFYPQKDYHNMFIGEIVSAFISE